MYIFRFSPQSYMQHPFVALKVSKIQKNVLHCYRGYFSSNPSGDVYQEEIAFVYALSCHEINQKVMPESTCERDPRKYFKFIVLE